MPANLRLSLSVSLECFGYFIIEVCLQSLAQPFHLDGAEAIHSLRVSQSAARVELGDTCPCCLNKAGGTYRGARATVDRSAQSSGARFAQSTQLRRHQVG